MAEAVHQAEAGGVVRRSTTLARSLGIDEAGVRDLDLDVAARTGSTARTTSP
jgi:hypothetical protein